MQYRSTLLFGFILLLAAFFASFRTTHADTAMAFLESLDREQRDKAQMSFENMSRLNWTFFPASMLPHAGISLRDLNEEQRRHVHDMLKTYLSDKGYEKTTAIMALEPILFELENGNPMRDKDAYVVGIYGNPDDSGVWGWCFQGHHVSLNFTIVKGAISMTPRFFGSNPARVPSGEFEGLRVLAAEEDLGFALLRSLDNAQRQKAIFSDAAYKEIVTGFSTEVGKLDNAGISHSELKKGQQKKLLELIAEYLSAMPNDQALTRMGVIEEEGLDNVYFGWAGSTQIDKPHYYRVQGNSFLIEFDNAIDRVNHVHTVWRDFEGDFGRDLLKEHYDSNH